MIIATVAAIMFLFGSSGGMFGTLTTKYAEKPIKNIIIDEGRREMALKSLSLLNDDIDEFNKQISDAEEQFSSLVKNYNSTPEDFNKLFSTTFAERQEQIDNIWKQRSDMLTNIKPEEWKKIIASAESAAQEE